MDVLCCKSMVERMEVVGGGCVGRVSVDERGEHDEGCDDYVDEDGICRRVGSFE